MSQDKRKVKLTEVDAAITSTHEGIQRREALHAELSGRLQALGRPRDRSAAQEQERLQRALLQIDEGVTRDEGVAFEELQPYEGEPGLNALRRTLSRLQSEASALRADIERWPDADARHRYRYTGLPQKAHLDGRDLTPGDVVELSQTQARAWADRFELVIETTVQDMRG